MALQPLIKNHHQSGMMRRNNADQTQGSLRRPLVNTKITVVSAPNQHISVSYQKNQIGQKSGVPEKLIPSSKELVLKPIQLTKSHFIDAYSKVRELSVHAFYHY